MRILFTGLIITFSFQFISFSHYLKLKKEAEKANLSFTKKEPTGIVKASTVKPSFIAFKNLTDTLAL